MIEINKKKSKNKYNIPCNTVRYLSWDNSYRVNRFKYHSNCVYQEIKRTDVSVKLFKC